MKIEVSNGEILDKLTIIEIKLEKISDPAKRKNLEKEYEILVEAAKGILPRTHRLYQALLEVNRQLWNIEDMIRELERRKVFGPAFVETARSVYHENDRRAALKREINEITGSGLIEEKSYKPY
ncbi:MAG: hypothetical protein GXO83_12010 [Chlorobi bacterium]|nr:hypothetical protein [Chlorobiota bacterium]